MTTLTLMPRSSLERPVNLFGQLQETGVTGENQHRPREDMQTPEAMQGYKHRTFLLHSDSTTNFTTMTYRGIVRQVPLWRGDVVVEHYARNPLLCLSLPEN